MVIEPMSLFLPLRQFGGKGLVSAGGTAWYDFADGWVPLVEHRRSAYAPDATLFAPGSPSPRGGPGPAADAGLNREHDDGEGAFDGREPGCVWHRLLIDAVLPSPAHVRIWSRAADEKRDLEAAPWFEEPPLGRRRSGPERAFLPDQPPPGGTYETLFQRARGRWLQLKLRLSSEGQARPRLFSLRVTYPRFSYLREYLPAIYRDDVESASFLDRFLANLEGLYTTIEERIAAVHLLLDPRSAPGEALPWLAAWLGVALDPSWEERRRRFFIAHAMQSFRSRGTARGIRAALHLAFGDVVEESLFSGDLPSLWSHDRIKLLEGSRLRQVPGSVRRSSEGIDDEGGAAHRFEVLLPLRPNGVTPSAKPARAGRPESRAQSLALAKRIIELAKPAHTTFQVRFYWEMFRVGEARVGLDRLLDSSSRVPELLPVLPLGSGALSQAWLAPLPGAGARTILGRDTLP
jgi:phage tail-like protein